nr:hypothetical protein [Nanoarchaeum sp.]
MLVEITGNEYTGRFEVELKNREVNKHGDFTEYQISTYWFEGQGNITQIKTQTRQKFLFQTPSRDEHGGNAKPITLENYLLYFGFIPGNRPNPRVLDKKAVNDLVLGCMYDNARINTNEEFIPRIFLPQLNPIDLEEQGLVKCL